MHLFIYVGEEEAKIMISALKIEKHVIRDRLKIYSLKRE